MVNGSAGRIGDGGSSRALEGSRDALKCFKRKSQSRATRSNTEGIGGASAGHFGGHREGIVGHRGQTGAKPVAILSKGQCRSCSAKRTWDASIASDERPDNGHRKALEIRPITSLYNTKMGFRRERGAQVRPRWAGPPDHVLEFYCRPVPGRIEAQMPRPCDARERNTPLNA